MACCGPFGLIPEWYLTTRGTGIKIDVQPAIRHRCLNVTAPANARPAGPSVADGSSELIGVTDESGCALPICRVPAQICGGRGASSANYRSPDGVFSRHGQYLTAGLTYGGAGGIFANGRRIVARGGPPDSILAPGVE